MVRGNDGPFPFGACARGGDRRGAESRRSALAVFALLAAFGAGCAHNPPGVYGRPGAAPSAGVPWKPPAEAVEKVSKVARAPETGKTVPLVSQQLLQNMQHLTLADIVNVALSNSTETHQAWAQALAAAAAYGSERGSYFPRINASASVDWQKNVAAGGPAAHGERTYSAIGSFSWLLFDFGGRGASIEETREALFAADWTHNAVIQNVILQVEQAYYNYLAAKALLAAQQATVDEEQTNLNAAEDRHTAGLATIADVLQSRTALSLATLALETLQGQIQTTRGILATAMGLPANTSLDVEIPIGAPPLEQTSVSVEESLDAALRERPDLAAARAQALEASARVRGARSQWFPSIEANGSVGRLYLENLSDGKEAYDVSIGVSIPVFTGRSRQYDILQAKAQADAARANARSVQDLVILQVWTSYYNLKTAEQKVRTSDDLLASATQNHEVAVGRYKAGVGSILDLLTAQSLLESARAQQIEARADWWLAVAQLAHDTGTLEVSSTPGAGIGHTGGSKEGTP